METIKISDADARHKELMAALGGIERALLLHAGIERALLLINDALRLQVVETGPANTQTEQEKVAAMQWNRQARGKALAQALNERGMNDVALQVLKQNEEGGKFKVETKVLHLDKGEIGVVTGPPSDIHGFIPVRWDGHRLSVYEKPESLEVVQQVLLGGQRVSSTSKFRGGLGTVTRLAEEGKLVAVAFDNGPELWIEACDLELIGGAT